MGVQPRSLRFSIDRGGTFTDVFAEVATPHHYACQFSCMVADRGVSVPSGIMAIRPSLADTSMHEP